MMQIEAGVPLICPVWWANYVLTCLLAVLSNGTSSKSQQHWINALLFVKAQEPQQDETGIKIRPKPRVSTFLLPLIQQLKTILRKIFTVYNVERVTLRKISLRQFLVSRFNQSINHRHVFSLYFAQFLFFHVAFVSCCVPYVKTPNSDLLLNRTSMFWCKKNQNETKKLWKNVESKPD